MSDANSRFKVIQGGGQPLPGARKKRRGDAVMCLCRVCKAEIGGAPSVWVKVKLGLMERDGKVEGGTDAWVCALCLAKGRVTRAT